MVVQLTAPTTLNCNWKPTAHVAAFHLSVAVVADVTIAFTPTGLGHVEYVTFTGAEVPLQPVA